MNVERIFTVAGTDTWNGGFYELAVELGERSDDRLEIAIKQIWMHPTLQGCYRDNQIEPTNQIHIPPALELLENYRHLFGIATLHDGKRIACGMYAVRETDGSDWLCLYIPIGALAATYPEVGSFPFGKDDSRSWREPLDMWFSTIGSFLYAAVPYSLGLVGHEVSGTIYSVEIQNQDSLPSTRYIGYMLPAPDKKTKSVWHPPTMYKYQ